MKVYAGIGSRQTPPLILATMRDIARWMARQGWTKKKSEDALAPGTRVKLTLATSRAGGFSGIVMAIQAEDGSPIVGGGRPTEVPDLDGKPGGLQPEGEIVLPGQDAQ